ncbi:MAG: hypothetical protein ACI9NQ_001407 [Paracoccaceae bacterium]|jgi:hypothetical protein
MTPPPLPEDIRDTEQLKLLAIFHYVLAGLGLVGLLFLAGHFMLMRTMFTVFNDLPKNTPAMTVDPEEDGTQVGEVVVFGEEATAQMPSEEAAEATKVAVEPVELEVDVFERLLGPMMIFYAIGGAFILLMMVLNFLSARKMGQRRGRIFSMVVAGFNCMNFPLGTALGVFTFVVLARTSIEASYRKVAGS